MVNSAQKLEVVIEVYDARGNPPEIIKAGIEGEIPEGDIPRDVMIRTRRFLDKIPTTSSNVIIDFDGGRYRYGNFDEAYLDLIIAKLRETQILDRDIYNRLYNETTENGNVS